jgi:hypothetical protein
MQAAPVQTPMGNRHSFLLGQEMGHWHCNVLALLLAAPTRSVVCLISAAL